MQEVNELAILVAAIVSVAVGSIWYSPLLFGPVWLKGAGLSSDPRDMPFHKVAAVALKGVLSQVVFLGTIAFIAERAAISLRELSMLLAVLLLSYLANLTVWEGRPYSYFLVHAGYGVIALVGGMCIITLWPW